MGGLGGLAVAPNRSGLAQPRRKPVHERGVRGVQTFLSLAQADVQQAHRQMSLVTNWSL